MKWKAKQVRDGSWVVEQANDVAGVALLGYATREQAVAVAVGLNQASPESEQEILAREWRR